jgi:hypothetical protein
MTENFYNDIYYYNPPDYPGYTFNRQQEKKYIAQFPYIQKESKPEKELQVFYNTTSTNGYIKPFGSTYKYTMPKSIDDIDVPSYNSISERQKRFRRELFENNIKKSKKKINLNLYFLFIIIVIFIMLCL